MSSCFFEDEERSFGVHPGETLSDAVIGYSNVLRQYLRKHRIILFLTNLDNRLLEHFSNCIDHNIHLAEVMNNILEQFCHRSCRGQIPPGRRKL